MHQSFMHATHVALTAQFAEERKLSLGKVLGVGMLRFLGYPASMPRSTQERVHEF